MDAAGNLNLGIYSPVRDTCVDIIPQSIVSVAGAAGRRGYVSHCLWFPVGVEQNCSLRLDFCPSSLGKNHKARCGAHRSLLEAMSAVQGVTGRVACQKCDV